MVIIALLWLLAGISFTVSQKYNNRSFEYFLAGLSLLLHGGLTAALIFIGSLHWFVVAPVLFMFVVVASAISGNEATRERKHLRGWFELQIALVFALTVSYLLNITGFNPSHFVLLISLILATVAHATLSIHLRRFRPPHPKDQAIEDKLPTVSLLIPARNEDHALKEALLAATQSEYPKLEILVLDDCSHDKTPEIIRGFAHEGIRFIEGQPLAPEWLGKNHALEQLRIAANGEVLLFCDVDVQLEPEAITAIVNLMNQESLDMVSILPRRKVFDSLATLLRPLTDFLLTVLPFQLLDGRAALGVCYAIRANSLQSINGYQDVPGDVFPEFEFAKKIIRTGRYKFFMSQDKLGVSIRKRFSSQDDSLIRILFPALRNDLLLALGALSLSAMTVAPYIYLIVMGPTPLTVLVPVLWSLAYARAVKAIHGRSTTGLAFMQFPLLVIHESLLLLVSLYKYLFHRVVWKERNICMPVLEATPRLPKLD